METTCGVKVRTGTCAEKIQRVGARQKTRNSRNPELFGLGTSCSQEIGRLLETLCALDDGGQDFLDPLDLGER